MERIYVANVNNLPEKLGKSVKVRNYDIALFKLSTGVIHAIENSCPHKGGVLSQGIISGKHVYCPMHNWKICTEEGKAQKPDEGCVKTFEVEIKDEKVYVCL
ncbi:nitrite reductase small subunit NirD [Fictibacillus phosphorivorans]|uniref:nitrite reductase small subunit NirD n=1 Tax=Fictibacillus phosphorivorans TaxID=1221500 RepID=UPI00203F0B63|nr:nitrite reductase small subunit NirD [Fictibacillus phosphorivorans]MCM3718806.1 nitrite reductase small subunit NirD [Fictibacillus phosphorivorans]MCM3776429.1 nitrite reductase small subunit NirD [Fictibacillus phosphorivorans]